MARIRARRRATAEPDSRRAMRRSTRGATGNPATDRLRAVSHAELVRGPSAIFGKNSLAGSLLLFSGHGDRNGYRVDIGIIVPGIVVTLAIVGLLSFKTMQLRALPARTGSSAMVGAPARVVDGFAEGRGRVQIGGEYWEASGPPGLAQGEVVTVTRVDGMTLAVDRRIA